MHSYFISEVPEIKIPFIVAIRPEITIVKEGESYVATSITPLKTLVNKFTDGEIKDFDFFGSDKTTQVRLIYPHLTLSNYFRQTNYLHTHLLRCVNHLTKIINYLIILYQSRI